MQTSALANSHPCPIPGSAQRCAVRTPAHDDVCRSNPNMFRHTCSRSLFEFHGPLCRSFGILLVENFDIVGIWFIQVAHSVEI
jgi:hypothetical protein